MVRSRRTAFTLVELLVVITIIGMLMAILLPAVGAATESARAAQCKNRVKQIALAMQGYESRNQSFPGYIDGREVGNSQKVVPFSWLVAIMPDMERQDVYDQYGRDDFEAPFLDFLTCPSDPPLNKREPYTSFVANAGLTEEDAPGCGILNTALPLRNKKGKKIVHQKTTLDKISSGDGASNTVILSENIDATHWTARPFFVNANHRDVPPGPAAKPSGSESPDNVMLWENRKRSEWVAHQINSPTQKNGSWEAKLANARPSSEHRGGVNVAFADGHVQFLKDSIDYSVYARLLSPDGKKCQKDLRTHKHRGDIDQTELLSDTDYK